MGVVERLPFSEADPVACFFTRLCEDSLPLDSERLGEPGRFSDFTFFESSAGFGLPEGVVTPLEAEPEAAFSFASGLALGSSSFFDSSAFSSSSSLCAAR